jgi:hypothetical protein
VDVAEIAYFGVEWSISASGDLNSGKDVCLNQTMRLRSKRFEKREGRVQRETDGGGRTRGAEFEIAACDRNMDKQRMP